MSAPRDYKVESYQDSSSSEGWSSGPCDWAVCVLWLTVMGVWIWVIAGIVGAVMDWIRIW